jgi:hypothetical protein
MSYIDIIPYDAAVLIVSKLKSNDSVMNIINITNRLNENSRKTYRDLCHIKFPKIFRYAKDKDFVFITYELLYLRLRNVYIHHGLESQLVYKSFDEFIYENGTIFNIDRVMARERNGLYNLMFDLIKLIYVKYIYKYMYEQRY